LPNVQVRGGGVTDRRVCCVGWLTLQWLSVDCVYIDTDQLCGPTQRVLPLECVANTKH